MKKISNGKITVRLNKYIADAGVCSRREADEFIGAGRVMVNGLPAEVGMKISEDDKIEVDGEVIKHKIAKPRPLAVVEPSLQTKRKTGKPGHKLKSLKNDTKKIVKDDISAPDKGGFMKKMTDKREETSGKRILKEGSINGLTKDSKKKSLSKAGDNHSAKGTFARKKEDSRKNDLKKINSKRFESGKK